jgi:hypothetical protein
MTQMERPKPVDSLERLGIKEPGDYQIFCPFCQHYKPKCGLSVRWRPGAKHEPDWLTGMFHCLRCDGAGSVRRGMLYPAKGLRVDGFGKTRVNTTITVRPEDAPTEYVQCYHAAWKVYRSLYPGSPGQAYMESRGFDPNIQAGWAPPGQSTLLNAGLPEATLRELKLIDAKGNDTLGSGGGRVILPFSWKGKIVTLYGRSITTNSLLKHYYTRSKVTDENGNEIARWRRGAFGDRCLDLNVVVLTEAPLDALALRQMGVSNACALGGTANDIAIERIQPGAKVGIALDNDTDREQVIRNLDGTTRTIIRNPGNDAAKRLATKLAGCTLLRIVPPALPNGEVVKDWAAYLQGCKQLGVEARFPGEVIEWLNGSDQPEEGLVLTA